MMTQGRAAPGRGQPASVVDFTQRRIERALRERARYRYVSPRVLRDADGFRIESPCCSRNVDPGGGVIDIARLARGPAGRWSLYARDHAARRWSWRYESADLDLLLELLCVDAGRVFWP
ncbi:DUF3024 domain-containing protein [Burkholderia vietnamiensis]|uniref:DUF3024 domain-containing protein n=1 Tax=Burkholderia vietnamiensis TaxID=60552 RepID=A0AAW7TDZ2_BURVI|nr:hypothetical protein [Burkholderia vietnamiensis]MDN7799725.1 hypothetical protein [Burkholderia vietnamiensis]HDR9189974.1 hypothetical protein [Burkholderia vietnamiensis]